MTFKKGQSGNPAGRRPGAKNKIVETFLKDLNADWQEHGAASIVKMREEDNTQYVKLVSQLVPKEATIGLDEPTRKQLTEIELATRVYSLLERGVAAGVGGTGAGRDESNMGANTGSTDGRIKH